MFDVSQDAATPYIGRNILPSAVNVGSDPVSLGLPQKNSLIFQEEMEDFFLCHKNLLTNSREAVDGPVMWSYLDLFCQCLLSISVTPVT